MLNERGSRRIGRAREEAGAARQPRAGGFEDLPVGETTTDGQRCGRRRGCGRHSSSSSSTRPEGPRRGVAPPGNR